MFIIFLCICIARDILPLRYRIRLLSLPCLREPESCFAQRGERFALLEVLTQAGGDGTTNIVRCVHAHVGLALTTLKLRGDLCCL